MANLAVTDWQMTVLDRRIETKVRFSYCRLVIPANTGSSYPSSGGIPLPTTFGMTRHIDYVSIVSVGGPSTLQSGAVMWTYDKNNHSMRAFRTGGTPSQGATFLGEAPTTFKVSLLYTTGLALYVEARGW